MKRYAMAGLLLFTPCPAFAWEAPPPGGWTAQIYGTPAPDLARQRQMDQELAAESAALAAERARKAKAAPGYVPPPVVIPDRDWQRRQDALQQEMEAQIQADEIDKIREEQAAQRHLLEELKQQRFLDRQSEMLGLPGYGHRQRGWSLPSWEDE